MDRKRQLHRKFVDYYSRSFGFARITTVASSPDVVLISVSGQGPDDLISTTSGEVPPLGVGLYIGIV